MDLLLLLPDPSLFSFGAVGTVGATTLGFRVYPRCTHAAATEPPRWQVVIEGDALVITGDAHFAETAIT
jgi:hypothetical protein